jgi:hypothetical protein
MGFTTGVQFPAGAMIGSFLFSAMSRWLFGPPSFLSSGYKGLFSWRQNNLDMKLTTHFHLVLRSGIRGAMPPPPNVFMVWCLINIPQLLVCKKIPEDFIVTEYRILVVLNNLYDEIKRISSDHLYFYYKLEKTLR